MECQMRTNYTPKDCSCNLNHQDWRRKLQSVVTFFKQKQVPQKSVRRVFHKNHSSLFHENIINIFDSVESNINKRRNHLTETKNKAYEK